MSWTLFIDESGQDRKCSPNEVLAGVAVEDRKLWPLIRNLSDAQQKFFGMRLFESYGKEAKAQNLLKTKVFRHASQLLPIDPQQRTKWARDILTDGAAVTRERLTALAQAKLAYCAFALSLCKQAGVSSFASIVPKDVPPNKPDFLRKDYAFLFERFYYFLNGKPDDPMGYLVFDELDKSASHILLSQMSAYFLKTQKGRTRSRLIIPEPFFVHSDLTSMVQIADLTAYIISWGLQLRGMQPAARPELAELATAVTRLRFSQTTDAGYTNYGFKVIKDLGNSQE